MRRPRTFRPVIGDALEDRAVPSGAGLGGSLGISRVIGTLPQRVIREFRTFQQTYNQDVRSVLLPAGTTNPANNRALFDQVVASALATLNASIDGTIANLSTASSLDAKIQGQLLGSGSNTLQSLLAAIPTPTSLSFVSVQGVTSEAAVYVNQTATSVAQEVGSSQSAGGGTSQQSVQQDLVQVQAAFRVFGQSYTADAQTVLLPPGTTNPSAHRPAFDQVVGASLVTLNTTIDTALGNLPSSLTAMLDTTLQNDLLSGGSPASNSLQSRLAALATPDSPSDFTARVFRFSSTLTISNAQAQVNRDIITAVKQFNAINGG